MEQVVARGSLIEQFEDVNEEQKARFLIKIVSVYNRQLERVRQQRLLQQQEFERQLKLAKKNKKRKKSSKSRTPSEHR
jgi:hypothetical protein